MWANLIVWFIFFVFLFWEMRKPEPNRMYILAGIISFIYYLIIVNSLTDCGKENIAFMAILAPFLITVFMRVLYNYNFEAATTTLPNFLVQVLVQNPQISQNSQQAVV